MRAGAWLRRPRCSRVSSRREHVAARGDWVNVLRTRGAGASAQGTFPNLAAAYAANKGAPHDTFRAAVAAANLTHVVLNTSSLTMFIPTDAVGVLCALSSPGKRLHTRATADTVLPARRPSWRPWRSSG